MKGWTITLTSALIALFVSTISENNSGNKIYIYASIISTFLFWCLDSLYLSKERKFIGIYNDLIGVSNGKNQKPKAIKEYEIPMNKYKGWQYCFIRAMLLPSEILFYVAIITGLFIFCKII